MDNSSTVVLLSGGLDSTTLLYYVKSIEDGPVAISFRYGQLHSKEVEAAAKTCAFLQVPHKIINLDIGALLKGSALTDPLVPVPQGHYEDSTMRQTVVPNRNMILLSIAAAWAISIGARKVAYAAHAGDHAIYPDCRPEFLDKVTEAVVVGNSWDLDNPIPLRVVAPFIKLTKTDILRLGVNLGVDYRLTWTCYKGEVHPCGKCGACNERAEAFGHLGMKDPLMEVSV
jgi:7-cyano-7-deazaguanine synthase